MPPADVPWPPASLADRVAALEKHAAALQPLERALIPLISNNVIFDFGTFTCDDNASGPSPKAIRTGGNFNRRFAGPPVFIATVSVEGWDATHKVDGYFFTLDGMDFGKTPQEFGGQLIRATPPAAARRLSIHWIAIGTPQ